jgi:hypothetical protein
MDLEKGKKELDQALARKEKDMGELNARLGDEQAAVGKLSKVIKETQVTQTDSSRDQKPNS